MPKVLVPLAAGCEELEAVTIIDLLRRAGIDVVVAGLQPGIVKASRGTLLVPDCTLDVVLHENFDMVVLPGGMPGMTHLKDDPRIIPLLQRMARDGKYTCAICAAPAVLAEAGLLKGKTATSFPGFVDRMSLPDTTFSNDPVVKDGRVITSRGPGTAMDFALELVETLAGRTRRDEVEAGLQRPGKY
ncbi:MAG: DJ-1/PfpI family protein [Sulfurimicrobium sp.]|nr:DJ-1/PfpI family protein [Sulfurimicrobium sp.]MDP2198143.1 DJ-1/PfpI family protein [Sulfurimicrobium sp.]MDP3686056.1 DJ-1/PfpI family protein [Sulfurimicrobium sp.]MDZ7656558.1 DJ-1 family glyoxalase III [Sulfurimicrobium sp.]